jgi:hypothetical protein
MGSARPEFTDFYFSLMSGRATTAGASLSLAYRPPIVLAVLPNLP